MKRPRRMSACVVSVGLFFEGEDDRSILICDTHDIGTLDPMPRVWTDGGWRDVCFFEL
jgi:hypothetical protein